MAIHRRHKPVMLITSNDTLKEIDDSNLMQQIVQNYDVVLPSDFEKQYEAGLDRKPSGIGLRGTGNAYLDQFMKDRAQMQGVPGQDKQATWRGMGDQDRKDMLTASLAASGYFGQQVTVLGIAGPAAMILNAHMGHGIEDMNRPDGTTGQVVHINENSEPIRAVRDSRDMADTMYREGQIEKNDWMLAHSRVGEKATERSKGGIMSKMKKARKKVTHKFTGHREDKWRGAIQQEQKRQRDRDFDL